jgi:protein SCO1/2
MAATKGKVVLMSFIYTHCTDICPFIALKIKDAYTLLGKDAASVVFVAVTIDPVTDAVLPSKESKEAVGADTDSQEPVQGLSKSDLALAGTIIQQFGGGYDVGHSAPFWIIDKKGMIRISMDADATPADLVTNVRILLKLR